MGRMVSYKFRIYPTEEQEEIFAKTFGCCRFVYNYILATIKVIYQREKRFLSCYEAINLISALKRKDGYEWLKEVNSQSLQATVINLYSGITAFFEKRGAFPKFKNKRKKQNFRIPQHFSLQKSKRGNWFLCIPKCKSRIRIEVHREVHGVIKQITITKDCDDRYYASLNCEVSDDHFKREYSELREEGIDLGLKFFAVISNGEKVEAPKLLRESEQNLIRAQRRLSRKEIGSANYEKARKKVARLHKIVSNQRKDFAHKLSSRLVNENHVIYLETLNIAGMIRNRCLAKSIADAGWGEFVRQLIYKALRRGGKIVFIGMFEPTSKCCSYCGTKNNELKLSDRIWQCKSCGVWLDRDGNASRNIKRLGQEMSNVKLVESSASISPTEGIQVGSVKQEPDSES